MTDRRDAVAELGAKGLGWLAPSGESLPCAPHDHCSAAKEAGAFPGEIAELEGCTRADLDAPARE